MPNGSVDASDQMEFSDADFRIVAKADQSKKVALDLSGLTTATKRTWTAPDKSGTVAMTSDIPAAASTTWTRINGGSISSGTGISLGATYSQLRLVVRCATVSGASSKTITLNLSSDSGVTYGAGIQVASSPGTSGSGSSDSAVFNTGITGNKYVAGQQEDSAPSFTLTDATESSQTAPTTTIKLTLSTGVSGTYALWGLP